MRILIALLLAVFVAQAPAHAAKPAASTEDIQTIKKKKKLAEAAKLKKLKQAEEAKKLKAKQKLAEDKAKKQKLAADKAKKERLAAKLADDKAKKKIAAKKAEDKAKKERRLASSGRACTGFFNCAFGSSRRSTSSAGFAGSRSVDGRATRKTVDWNDSKYKPGSIVVRTPERALYLVLGDGEAMRYSVGVGREGFQWGGTSRVEAKKEWPDWRPPAEMIRREAAKGHIIPEFMEGGPGNPLGARAMYIGGTIYRIHGTNNAASIGGAVSSGCIRMMNADVIDLYERVRVGARVYVYQ
jgi:lipoprotein-anchoring transpeptidase ErfK/SrfK